jgi:hypothetical protein
MCLRKSAYKKGELFRSGADTGCYHSRQGGDNRSVVPGCRLEVGRGRNPRPRSPAGLSVADDYDPGRGDFALLAIGLNALFVIDGPGNGHRDFSGNQPLRWTHRFRGRGLFRR